MEKLTNDQVRKAVLEALYEDENKNPEEEGLYRFNLQKELKVSHAQISACASYLKQKGLITVSECQSRIEGTEKIEGETGYDKASDTGEIYSDILKITALGVDVVERKEKQTEFPFMQVIQNISGTLQNIGGDNYGNLTAAQGNQNVITINQQITDALKQAYDKVKDSELPPQQKESINGQLKDLEQELHKEDKADVGKIQKISKWLKDNANWIVPILSDVIKKGLEKACGI